MIQTYADTTAQAQFKKLIAANVYVVPTLYIGHTLSFLDENDHSTDGYLKYNYIGPGIQKHTLGALIAP